jgi:hypothetical protein
MSYFTLVLLHCESTETSLLLAVAPFVDGITTKLVGINNHDKKQNPFRSTMASSLSPNCSSPELEKLYKSFRDHNDYVSLLSILSRKKKWLTKEEKAGFLKKFIETSNEYSRKLKAMVAVDSKNI